MDAADPLSLARIEWPMSPTRSGPVEKLRVSQLAARARLCSRVLLCL